MLHSLDDYLHAKKTKTSIDSFLKYCWSKNLAIWLDKKHNWPHPTKNRNPRCYLHLILSRDIDDQKILLSDWRRGTIFLLIKISLRCFLPSMTGFIQKNLRDRLIHFMNIDDKKNPAFWLDESHSIASIPSSLEGVGKMLGRGSRFLNSNYKFYFTTLISITIYVQTGRCFSLVIFHSMFLVYFFLLKIFLTVFHFISSL